MNLLRKQEFPRSGLLLNLNDLLFTLLDDDEDHDSDPIILCSILRPRFSQIARPVT